MHLAIIIPAYNEEQIIGTVLQRLPSTIVGVSKITKVVIDDGSQDQTAQIASRYGVIVLRHRINLGVGAATTTGFQAAQRINADLVVTLDADGQHNPAELVNLIKPIIECRADVVIGSRLKNPSGMPVIKIIGNWTFNSITYLFSGVWTTDSQSGYRAFSRLAIDMMQLKTNGYEICSETLVEIGKQKLRLLEYPIQSIYTDYAKLKGQHPLNGVNILIKLLLRGVGGTK